VDGGFIHSNSPQKFTHALVAGMAAELISMKNQRLSDYILDAIAGVEGTERILKNDLHVAAKAT
jgi:hypothetical protein